MEAEDDLPQLSYSLALHTLSGFKDDEGEEDSKQSDEILKVAKLKMQLINKDERIRELEDKVKYLEAEVAELERLLDRELIGKTSQKNGTKKNQDPRKNHREQHNVKMPLKLDDSLNEDVYHGATSHGEQDVGAMCLTKADQSEEEDREDDSGDKWRPDDCSTAAPEQPKHRIRSRSNRRVERPLTSPKVLTSSKNGPVSTASQETLTFPTNPNVVRGPSVTDVEENSLHSDSLLASHAKKDADKAVRKEDYCSDGEESSEDGFKCKECGKTFSLKRYLKEHIERMHMTSLNFQCDACDYSASKEWLLKKHKLRKHIRPFSCEICGKGFPFQYALRSHMLVHIKEKASCKLSFKTKNNLKAKIEDTVSVKLVNTRAAPAQEQDMDTLCLTETEQSVVKEEESDSSGDCLPDDYNTDKVLEHQTENRESLYLDALLDDNAMNDVDGEVHKKEHCSDGGGISVLTRNCQFKCQECEKTFSQKYYLKEHVNRMHMTNLKFQCDICDYSAARNGELRKHKLRKHIKPFICDVCGKGFPFEYALKNHMSVHINVHTNKKTYTCEICKQIFPKKIELYGHIKETHPGENACKCNVCGMNFATQHRVMKHKVEDHGMESGHKCHVCDRVFLTATSLKKHHQIHTGEHRFQCEICGRKFRSKGHMERHILTHGERERTFMCEQCGKGFLSSDSLKNHLVRQHGEKIFTCEICGKPWATKERLKKHVQIHNPGLQCYICDYKTSNKYNLKTHINKVHNMAKEFTDV